MPEAGLTHNSTRKVKKLLERSADKQDKTQGPFSLHPLPANGTDEHLVGRSRFSPSAFYARNGPNPSPPSNFPLTSTLWLQLHLATVPTVIKQNTDDHLAVGICMVCEIFPE